MNEVMNINGIECYEKDGTAYLKLETVARGLGFTQEKKGVEYVRWETVTKYLEELNFPNKLGKDSFIPENIFYRLAMKAKNEAAEKFQAKVADEIIPSIRKTGSYGLPKSFPEALRLAADLAEKNQQLSLENSEMKPKAEFYDAVADSKTAIPMDQVAKVLAIPGIGRNKLFELLRNMNILQSNNIPYQSFIDRGYFRTIETKYTKPNGDTCINIKTLVYQKGVDYIRSKINEVSLKPQYKIEFKA